MGKFLRDFLVYFLLYSLQGHVKVVQYLVKEVNQFPSDIECMRYIATITDKVGLICYWSTFLFFVEIMCQNVQLKTCSFVLCETNHLVFLCFSFSIFK